VCVHTFCCFPYGTGFELRALDLLDKHSTTWVTPPALCFRFVCLFPSRAWYLCPAWSGSRSSSICSSWIAGMTGACHYPQLLLIEMGVSQTFCLFWL
jgi:hypothetical protein